LFAFVWKKGPDDWGTNSSLLEQQQEEDEEEEDEPAFLGVATN